MIKANRFIRDNRNEAIKILTAWGRVDRGSAESSYDSTVTVFSRTGNIPEDGSRSVIETPRADFKMTKPINASDLVALTQLHEAQKELANE